MRMNSSNAFDRRLALAMLVPAIASTLTFVPGFLTLPSEEPMWQFYLQIGAAPLAALVVNSRLAAAATRSRAAMTGLPQVLLLPLLINIDIWIDYLRGYYVGGELGMARGVGTFVYLLFGVAVMVLVAICAQLGTWIHGRSQ